MALEAKIRELVETEGWASPDVVHVSASKNTAVLVVIANGASVIVKACFAQPEELSRLEFELELKCYQKFAKFSTVPELLFYGDNYLALEYIDGGSLYQNYISKNQKGSNSLSLLALVLLEFNQSVGNDSHIINVELIASEVAKLVRSLLLCGPKGTKNSFLHHALLKVVELVVRPLITLVITSKVRSLIEEGLPMGSRLHGDTHMNNFVENSSGQIFLIDFERVREEPGLLVDALYTFSTFYALHSATEEEIAKYISELFPRHTNSKKLNYLFKLLASAVQANPRFGLKGSVANLPSFISTIFLRS
jgi:predicted Ser/Thr protein kinase